MYCIVWRQHMSAFLWWECLFKLRRHYKLTRDFRRPYLFRTDCFKTLYKYNNKNYLNTAIYATFIHKHLPYNSNWIAVYIVPPSKVMTLAFSNTHCSRILNKNNNEKSFGSCLRIPSTQIAWRRAVNAPYSCETKQKITLNTLRRSV